jgi:polyferredoxin
MLESILAKSAFLESMNFVSYSPDNSTAYLLRALSFVGLMIIFYFRYLVVGTWVSWDKLGTVNCLDIVETISLDRGIQCGDQVTLVEPFVIILKGFAYY